MENVVTVVNQSPPDVMVSTKPAVQAARSPGQDSFEMVLQKTSDRVENKKSDDVHSDDEHKPKEVQNSENSSSNQPVSVTQNKREVKKTDKNEKVDKLKNADDVKSDANSKVPVVQPEKTAVIQPQIILDAETPVETSIDANAKNLSISAENPVGTKSEEPVDIKIQNQSEKAPSETTATINTQSGLPDQFSTLKTNQKVDPQVEIKEDSDQTPSNTTKTQDIQSEGKISIKDVQIETQSQVPIPVIEKSVSESTAKKVVAEKGDSAPPDIPKVTDNVATTASVTTSQLNEPARLAEAPKNEIVTQVASQIEQMVKTNRSSMRVQLYPEELGHIDLKIVSTKSGIGVSMIADSASTQEILKSSMNSLKQNMQQAGIQLNNLNIGQGQTSNKQQQFDEKKNFANNPYQSTKVPETNSFGTTKKVQLQTTAIDYRI